MTGIPIRLEIVRSFTPSLPRGLTLHHADCRDALRTIPDNSIDSVVTDPPYALVSVVKRFGGANAAPAKDYTGIKEGATGAYMRASAGFMGKKWDTGECAMDWQFWGEVLRVLKPGGFVAAFGASRGYHRMACAIEDAGFEIRDSLINVIDPDSPIINFMESLNEEQLGAFLRCLDDATFGGTLAWMYGTGFPKSHDVSKGIDREAGAKRKAVGRASNFGKTRLEDGKTAFGDYAGEWDITAPATAAAAEWDGWGTALKPAFEPIALARKPLSEKTVAANVLKWRTGSLNIDGCRIGTDKDVPASASGNRAAEGYGMAGNRDGSSGMNPNVGRWPANVVHDGSGGVVTMFPTNSARFFYSAKASKADRAGSKHPTVKPIALMQWLTRLITPPGGTVLDPFAGSGTTGEAARREGFACIMCEREDEYVADIVRRFG